MRSSAFCLPILFAILPAAALAEPLPPTPATNGVVVTAKGKNDPNRQVCRKVETTGSRLGGTKICRTAAEWAEIKDSDRRDIERIQANRYNGNQ